MSQFPDDPRYWKPTPPKPLTRTGDLGRMTRNISGVNPETPRIVEIASPWRNAERNKAEKATFLGFWLMVLVVVSLIVWLLIDNTEEMRLTQSVMIIPFIVALLLLNASKVENNRPLVISLIASLVALVFIAGINWQYVQEFTTGEYIFLILGTFFTLYMFTKSINLEMKK